MDKGKVWIDHSTTDYEATMIYNEMVIDKGAQLLEAPITGTKAEFAEECTFFANRYPLLRTFVDKKLEFEKTKPT